MQRILLVDIFSRDILSPKFRDAYPRAAIQFVPSQNSAAGPHGPAMISLVLNMMKRTPVRLGITSPGNFNETVSIIEEFKPTVVIHVYGSPAPYINPPEAEHPWAAINREQQDRLGFITVVAAGNKNSPGVYDLLAPWSAFPADDIFVIGAADRKGIEPAKYTADDPSKIDALVRAEREPCLDSFGNPSTIGGSSTAAAYFGGLVAWLLEHGMIKNQVQLRGFLKWNAVRSRKHVRSTSGEGSVTAAVDRVLQIEAS